MARMFGRQTKDLDIRGNLFLKGTKVTATGAEINRTRDVEIEAAGGVKHLVACRLTTNRVPIREREGIGMQLDSSLGNAGRLRLEHDQQPGNQQENRSERNQGCAQ